MQGTIMKVKFGFSLGLAEGEVEGTFNCRGSWEKEI